MLFYDQNGALGQFQGFSNVTHEYRINNIAPGGSINVLIGNTSRFQVLNSGDISISGALLKGGTPFLHNSGESTFAGLNSGNFSMTGDNNTGFGALALVANTGGTDNVAVGAGTLDNNTTGSFNTAVGRSALHFDVEGKLNTAVGYAALFSTDTGIQNTAVGTTTMVSNTSGHSNTAIGQDALDNNTTGTNNTAIGFSAGTLATTGSGNIYLGALVQGVADESNTMYLGGPLQSRTFIGGVRGVSTGVGNAVAVVIDSNGQLGTLNSSRRYKEDIQDMGDASSGLMKLRPVTYRYKQTYTDGTKPIDYGLIAEEVQQVYPDLVAHQADGEVEQFSTRRLTRCCSTKCRSNTLNSSSSARCWRR